MVVLKCNLSCVDPNGRGEALRSRATKTTIGFFIAIILLVVTARSFGGFSTLRAIGREGSYFLKLKTEGTRASITGVLFKLGGRGAIAPGAASIYLTKPKQKVECGFGLYGNAFLDGLVPSIFLTTILLDLGTDEEPYCCKTGRWGLAPRLPPCYQICKRRFVSALDELHRLLSFLINVWSFS